MLERFANAIRSLPSQPTAADLLTDVFRLHSENKVEIYYVPFDYVNKSAKVVIVGITPGLQQMELAFQAARQALLDGSSIDDASAWAKMFASFGGPMRRNLTKMLDGLGLPAALNVPESESLFRSNSHLLHPTSAVRYPVFVGGENYHGDMNIIKNPNLLAFVEKVLVAELAAMPSALVIPCGKYVDAALRHLASKGLVDQSRCLVGFPHPSGGNGWRVRHFQERQTKLAAKIKDWVSSKA